MLLESNASVGEKVDVLLSKRTRAVWAAPTPAAAGKPAAQPPQRRHGAAGGRRSEAAKGAADAADATGATAPLEASGHAHRLVDALLRGSRRYAPSEAAVARAAIMASPSCHAIPSTP